MGTSVNTSHARAATCVTGSRAQIPPATRVAELFRLCLSFIDSARRNTSFDSIVPASPRAPIPQSLNSHHTHQTNPPATPSKDATPSLAFPGLLPLIRRRSSQGQSFRWKPFSRCRPAPRDRATVVIFPMQDPSYYWMSFEAVNRSPPHCADHSHGRVEYYVAFLSHADVPHQMAFSLCGGRCLMILPKVSSSLPFSPVLSFSACKSQSKRTDFLVGSPTSPLCDTDHTVHQLNQLHLQHPLLLTIYKNGIFT